MQVEIYKKGTNKYVDQGLVLSLDNNFINILTEQYTWANNNLQREYDLSDYDYDIIEL